MTEAAWYFAQGDTEQGPVTLAQLQSLLASGKVAPGDLVWKEGMEDWAAARDVPELNAPAGPNDAAGNSRNSPDSSLTSPTPSRMGSIAATASAAVQPNLVFAQLAGRSLLLVGLALVVLTRGCDTMGDRYVARVEAIAQVAEAQFQANWDQQKAKLETERDKLLDQPQTPQEQERIQELNAELRELDDSMREEMQRLRRTRWSENEAEARNAGYSNQMWAYWRALFFVFGTMLLSTGLLLTGLSGTGPERWMSLVLLTVIIFSIYVLGSVWS